MLASSIPLDLINKQLQMQAQSHLEQARFYKTTQQFEMALVSYDQAKVIFKHAENACKRVPPLSELKSVFSQAHTPQTSEDESLRRRIAEVYLERAEFLKSLGQLEKAEKSYEKAQAWGYESIPVVSTANSISSIDSASGLLQLAEFLPFKASLVPSPKVVQACLEETHQWVAQVFDTILKQFQDLDLCQSSPSLFLVYAHNNNRLGKADAEVSQRVIQWLSNLRANLYSDRSASGHQAVPFSATLEENAKANDIFSSQLCLLPNHAGTVDHVVLCGSELLGHYMASPYYQGFCEAIKNAYQQASQHANDFSQIEAAIRKVVDANLNEKEFHHVLTELAFLQIRHEYQNGEHGIIPMLLNSTAQQCLPKFIVDSTTIRIEDSIWRMPSMWKGRQTYQNEGLHIGFFKLLKRLLVKQERCIALVEEKIYQVCLQKLREDHAHTLTAEEFSLFLNHSCVSALDALKQEHGSDLREMNVQKAYENILTEIKQINGESLVALDQLSLALEASYSAKRLAIQRLSGLPLLMEYCYVNLAVVEHEKEEKTKESNAASKGFHRLPSAEAISSHSQKLVPLEKLFDPRELSKDKTVTPKRILIRGRAGVGKTTLSKKIVYEYTQKGQWRDRFDYLLWIPLRTLKGKSNCDLVTLFHETYFQHHPKGRALAKTLAAQINGRAKERTLFVLDGWDEVAQEWGEHEPMSEFLKHLLNQPAVLITSRPYVDLKQAQPMDFELETVGFSPENVIAYLDNRDIISSSDAKEMKGFIQANAFIQELVNVPIQLDALYYSWDEIKRMQKNAQDAITVTTLYQTMVNKLWRKDMLRLGKREGGELLTEGHVSALERPSRIEKLVKSENDFLSALAFTGLQNNQIEFTHRDLHRLIEQLETQGVDLSITLEANLKKLSFLHTDDAEESHRSYHFMHLTFQEFFAAKFLVKHLQAHANTVRKSIEAQAAETDITLGVKPSLEELEAFIATHKYNPRYEIVWWMVAGLLEGAALERFFTLLEAAPRDLIGVRHQQVMMGCLNEARAQLKATTIAQLEKKLMQWLNFEIKNGPSHHSRLGCQRVFPEHLLVKSLSQAEVEKEEVIAMLSARPALSSGAVRALTASLKDENGNVREAAADALGRQSALPSDAIQALNIALKDENAYVRQAATGALGRQSMLSSDGVHASITSLKDENRYVGEAAEEAVGSQSTLSSDAVQDLITSLKDEKWYVREEAANILGRQSGLPSGTVQALLIVSVEDKNGDVRKAVESALDRQSAMSSNTVQVLIASLKDENGNVRRAAARALGSQSTLSSDAAQALTASLKDENRNVRRVAARALGSQSTLSSDAVQALITSLTDKEDRSLRSEAARALGSHMTQLFTLLPKLEAEQIKELFTQVLFRYSYKQVTPLYIQNHQLHFYTARGLEQPIQLTAKQSQMITEAFKSAHAEAGITSPEEERLAYTARSSGQTIWLSSNQSQVVTEPFKTIQEKARDASLLKWNPLW